LHAHELLSPTTTAVAAKRLIGTPVVAKVLRGGYLGDIARLRNRLGGPARLRAFRREVDVFISVSADINAEVGDLGIPTGRRVLIPNGVDIRTFYPVSPGMRQVLRKNLDLPDGLLAIYTGRLSPEKQIDQLLAIWPAVRASVPQATLLILGTGPEEVALRQQAGEGVTIRGRVEDVAPYLQVSDLFVLPSKGEGLSNAMLEAMATGLPVVTTKVSGSVDLVRDGINGCLVPGDNPIALKQAILDLLSDDAKRAYLGHEARVVIESGYSLEKTCQRLCDLYASVIQQKNVAPKRVLRSEP
jgi:glycosyltransferase involved in cell wall biosynthesis